LNRKAWNPFGFMGGLLLPKDQYILQKSTDLRALIYASAYIIYALAHKLTLALINSFFQLTPLHNLFILF